MQCLLMCVEIQEGEARLVRGGVVALHLVIHLRFGKTHADAAKGSKGIHQCIGGQCHARISMKAVQEKRTIVWIFSLHCLSLQFFFVVTGPIITIPGTLPCLALLPSKGTPTRHSATERGCCIFLRQTSCTRLGQSTRGDNPRVEIVHPRRGCVPIVCGI